MTKSRFIMLSHEMLDSDTFAGLSRGALHTLLLLLRKHNGHNNGQISLGVREIKARCRCGQMTACRALDELQTAGFISQTYRGRLVPEPGRPNVASRWQLNFVAKPERKVQGQTRVSSVLK